jgi:DNA-binding MarR family transcriptional regulator
MDRPALNDQEHTLWILLCQARDAMMRVRDSELNKRGLTAVEAGALRVIHVIGENATPAMISKSMLRQHHSVTALLKRMENKGLVMRVESPERKNTWLINMTEKGQEAYDKSNIGDSLYELMSVLMEDEKVQLQEYLTKLRDKALRYATVLQVQLPPFP